MKKSLEPKYSKLTTIQIFLWIFLAPIILYPLSMIVATSLKPAENNYGHAIEAILWLYPFYILVSAGIIYLISRKVPILAAILLLIGYIVMFITFVLAIEYIV